MLIHYSETSGSSSSRGSSCTALAGLLPDEVVGLLPIADVGLLPIADAGLLSVAVAGLLPAAVVGLLSAAVAGLLSAAAVAGLLPSGEVGLLPKGDAGWLDDGEVSAVLGSSSVIEDPLFFKLSSFLLFSSAWELNPCLNLFDQIPRDRNSITPNQPLKIWNNGIKLTISISSVFM